MEYKEFKPIIIATIVMIAMLGALCIATPAMAEGNDNTVNDTNVTVVLATALEPTQSLPDVLVYLSDKLGIASERIFGIFVNAQVWLGLITLASLCVAILCAYAVAMYMRCMLARDEISAEPTVVLFVPILAGVVVFFMVLAMTEYVVGNAVLKIMCPEYVAAKELIGLLNL